MSMFDKIKEQATRAATSKVFYNYYYTNVQTNKKKKCIDASTFGQNATRQVGDMANNASKFSFKIIKNYLHVY